MRKLVYFKETKGGCEVREVGKMPNLTKLGTVSWAGCQRQFVCVRSELKTEFLASDGYNYEQVETRQGDFTLTKVYRVCL